MQRVRAPAVPIHSSVLELLCGCVDVLAWAQRIVFPADFFCLHVLRLQDHNLQVQLEKMEGKLRQLSTNIYEMDDFIKTKESETNFRQLGQHIGMLVDELNVHVKKSVL